MITNIQFEEIIIHQKKPQTKINLKETLLSESNERINISDYTNEMLIDNMPQKLTTQSELTMGDLLNVNLSDQQLRKCLNILLTWESDKNLDHLYEQLFNKPICQSQKEGFTFNEDELVIILSQLTKSVQTSISENPQKIENISNWITLIIETNKVLLPKNETLKLLQLLIQYQKFSETVQSTKLIMTNNPVPIQKKNQTTHVYF